MKAEPLHPSQIVTPQGVLHFEPPTRSTLSRLHNLLPFGLRKINEAETGARFGIVVQWGEDRLQFVKQQPPEVSIEDALTVYLANSLLIASTIPAFLVRGHEGCFWPLNYVRRKAAGVESGIAYTGMERVGYGDEAHTASRAYDDDIGTGFTDMMVAFIEELKLQSKKTGITLQDCIGLDVRDRNHLENISFNFLVLDQEVICLKTSIREDDPVWTVLRANGIDSVIHMPAVPIELEAG